MSKARGNYYERALVKAFKDRDLEAWRVPLSGALGESDTSTLPDRVKAYLTGDVCVCINQTDIPVEVKFRTDASGFTKVYEQMGRPYQIRTGEQRIVRYSDCVAIRGVDAFIEFNSGLAGLQITNSNESFLNATLTRWLDQCKVLALRSKKNREWYFICI